MGGTFRVRVCFCWTPLSRPCPNPPQGAAGPPKSSFFIEICFKRILKLPIWFLSVLFPTFVENLGTPRWRQVSHSAFFPFPCKTMGRAMLVHLRIFLGCADVTPLGVFNYADSAEWCLDPITPCSPKGVRRILRLRPCRRPPWMQGAAGWLAAEMVDFSYLKK